MVEDDAGGAFISAWSALQHLWSVLVRSNSHVTVKGGGCFERRCQRWRTAWVAARIIMAAVVSITLEERPQWCFGERKSASPTSSVSRICDARHLDL